MSDHRDQAAAHIDEQPDKLPRSPEGKAQPRGNAAVGAPASTAVAGSTEPALARTAPQATAAQGHYESSWFGWCELCDRRRLRIFWWVEGGIAYDTVCKRCRPEVTNG